MTIKELKNKKDYLFKCYVSKRTLAKPIKEGECVDEWGCAFLSLGDREMVEYNFCIDNTTGELINSSAIYKVCYYKELEECFSEVDTSNYIHYEIDFSNRKWKKELETAMCEAAIKLFNL